MSDEQRRAQPHDMEPTPERQAELQASHRDMTNQFGTTL
jgi:hypothetical protein